MTSNKSLAIASILLLGTGLLTACESGKEGQQGGTVIGGVVGGLIGSRFGSGSGAVAATIIGSLAGAWAGNQIGQKLDEKDRDMADAAHTQALASGNRIQWNNPDTGNSGTVSPTRDGYDTTTGRYCREFQTEIVVDDAMQTAFGTACRNSDGTWKIVDQKQ